MRTFACRRCGQLVFFDNTACLNCGAGLGFLWETRELQTLTAPAGAPDLLAPIDPDGNTYVRCRNVSAAACNWLVRDPGSLCFSCSLTRTRPGDDDPGGLAALAEAEAAKRRLMFELGELSLPIVSFRDRAGGLVFDLLSSRDAPVTTGHAGGVITLDLAESDHVRRIQRRQQLQEAYRTVLGHLRHEIGHYFFPILTPDPGALERVRAAFGDERADYNAALERHYQQGPPDDWAERHVSAYATMHPSEDWAETFAHYLHIRDTLQTAASHRVQVHGPETGSHLRPAGKFVSIPGSSSGDFGQYIATWLPLTYALNALNRSMGRDDLYPFVLAGPVQDKLGLVHELCVIKNASAALAVACRRRDRSPASFS